MSNNKFPTTYATSSVLTAPSGAVAAHPGALAGLTAPVSTVGATFSEEAKEHISKQAKELGQKAEALKELVTHTENSLKALKTLRDLDFVQQLETAKKSKKDLSNQFVYQKSMYATSSAYHSLRDAPALSYTELSDLELKAMNSLLRYSLELSETNSAVERLLAMI
jgi:coenzyme F420-reducing hydrogenase alpha subunit